MTIKQVIVHYTDGTYETLDYVPSVTPGEAFRGSTVRSVAPVYNVTENILDTKVLLVEKA